MTPTSQGRTAPPMLPLAKTGPLALRADSRNQRGNKETLIGKIDASPKPASSDPGMIQLRPRAPSNASPPSKASVSPVLANAVSGMNRNANGAEILPASNA